LKSRTPWEVRDPLDELAELAATAGAEVIATARKSSKRLLPQPSLAAARPTIARHCQSHEVDTVIFDDDLSPAQSRNLEIVPVQGAPTGRC